MFITARRNAKKSTFKIRVKLFLKGKLLTSTKVIVRQSIDSARTALKKDESLSTSAKEVITSLLNVSILLSNHLNLNSSNSSKPPSSDPNRVRKQIRTASGKKRKSGAQPGHKGAKLIPSEKPDMIEQILVDRSTLPAGKYEHIGFESRQVFDIEVSFKVTEYQAEILRDKKSAEYIADFPVGVTEPTQYGNAVKATSVYMSQHQLIPQARVCDIFKSQFGLSISNGSVNNFNFLAAKKLEDLKFEDWLRGKLLSSTVLHADETGINVGGEKYWIHCLCNGEYTFFLAHKKRGTEAMDAMNVLPYFKGLLVHDHWKPYFTYICKHILCNAHHRRELERAFEQDGQKWALKMKNFLDKLNTVTTQAGGVLSDKVIILYRKKYQKILKIADKECPENLKQRAQSKSRNLLERLLEYEEETLRFMENEEAPFTNNQGERDLRMTKVQQKISGCFRAIKAAQNFCLIRSYLATCRKNGVSPMEALQLLFSGKLPNFMLV